MVLLSHPETNIKSRTPLIAHLFSVSESMQKMLPCENDKLQELARIIGICHDIAKATTDFQSYLRGDINQSPHVHARTGALLTVASAIHHPISFTSEQLVVAYNAVYYHHRTRLDTDQPHEVIYEHSDALIDDMTISDIGRKRVEQIINSGNQSYLEYVLSAATTENITSQETIMDMISEAESRFNNDVSSVFKANDSVISRSTYEMYLSVWSTLSLADISHASRLFIPKEYERPTRNVIDAAIDKMDASDEIDQYREQARKDALHNTKHIDWSQYDVGTLALPTGLGKTFTGMSVALDILDRSENSEDEQYHNNGVGNVIYALPFTSIIDQTVDVFNNVFDISCDHSTRLTTHHHLSETISHTKLDGGSFLGESWFSGVTITTFVQLFESLICPNRSSSTKIPQIQDSVIVIDEPQALPRSWWSLIQRIAETVTKQYNATIISMTATQPNIFQRSENLNTVSLLSDSEKYYTLDSIERVEYKIDNAIVTDEYTAYETLFDMVTTDTEMKRLVIANTIDSADEICKHVEKDTDSRQVNKLLAEYSTDIDEFVTQIHENQTLSKNEYYHIHITSRHRPIDRRRLLAVIKQIDKPIVVTSTQILEAGVDISFDAVYRDVAPIQNISQAAGRCNRNGLSEDLKTVTIVELPHPIDKDQKPPSKAIYSEGTNTIHITKNLLENIASDRIIQQKSLDYDSVSTYYDDLWSRTEGNKQYVKYYNTCNLKKLSELSLIETQKSVNILVSDDMDMINSIRNNFNSFAFETAKQQINSMNQYVVSVPIYNESDEEKIAALEDLHESDIQDHKIIDTNSVFYSTVYGFQIPESTVDNRLL